MNDRGFGLGTFLAVFFFVIATALYLIWFTETYDAEWFAQHRGS